MINDKLPKIKTLSSEVYSITYNPENTSFDCTKRYITNSIEEAIEICKEENKNCFIKEVKYLFTVKYKSTKTIIIDV